MNPATTSFEAMIGLALKGNDWQQLQGLTNTTAMALDETPELESDDAAVFQEVAGEVNQPRLLTVKQKKKMQRFDQTIARDTGAILQTIEADALTPVPQSVTWDQDPEIVCCYNWQASNDGTNTIYVPGGPAKWEQPTLPHTLDRDSGLQYADYNYVRQPKDPYSPMFQALSVMNPDYRFNDVDVLADRNNLRVLLEFCQGKANGPFRLDVYLVSNTLVIVRKESRWWKNSDGVGYGCNFEKFFTRPAEGMEDATSHYRAIRYPLGPLNVVCRFEADAYDDGIVTGGSAPSDTVSGGLAARPHLDLRAPIKVLPRGRIIPTAQLVELKTQRYDPERVRLVQCQDQLWFGRTSLLFTGPYGLNTGVINRIKYEDATERIKNWEENNQDSLRKLPALLSQLRSILKRERRPNYAIVLVREDKAGPLTVRTMEGNNHGVGRQFFRKHWQSAHVRPTPQAGGHQNTAYRGGRQSGVGYRGGPQGGGPRGGMQAGGYNGGPQANGHPEPRVYHVQRGGRGGAVHRPLNNAPQRHPQQGSARGRGQYSAPTEQ